MEVHPLVRAAAEGRLPSWTRISGERREHVERVGRLMERWARARRVPEADVVRWTAAAHLHDALRDAPPAELRSGLAGDASPGAPPASGLEGAGEPDPADLPGPLLHGPAAAARLRREGVEDEKVLRAVAFHTLGHPAFGALGRALYCADFLDPGRSFRREWREGLRRRLPGELDDVTREIAAARIGHLLERRERLFPVTVAFWNRLACEGGS